MADDSDSDTKENPPVAKEKEFWGVPMSTLYGIGIVAAGTLSLITALKVLLPPNFQLFPQQAGSESGSRTGIAIIWHESSFSSAATSVSVSKSESG